ncbi:hypothetical protein ACJMK2_030890 [Sinanodonta woodiana]|uniref:Small integral membrane protein 20 n=1 Tax=Sinanodonta woodiana TaxID=1069815 RepID=A0ABD3WZ63_SINWO
MRKGGMRWVPVAFVCGISAAMYPIFIHPYFFPEKWQDVQRITRSGIEQEKIQPAGLKVWSDPFDRKKT